MGNLTRVSEAFNMSRHRLISANQNQGSLLATLVGPQVSQYIPRAPPRNPTYNGRHYNPQPTRPQVHRSIQSPSQTQHQFQNMRVETRSNYSTVTRPVQAYPNQEQQRWRPRSDR